MSEAGDAPLPFTREKPWFERHIRVVLGALSVLLLAVVWFTSAMNDSGRRSEAPLKAEGIPPVPVQAGEPSAPSRTSRAEPIERAPAAAPPAQPPPLVSREPRAQPRPKPSPAPQALVSQDITGRPLVVDAATLIFGSTAVCIDGIAGTNALARDVNQYLGTDSLICKQVRSGIYSCLRKSDNKDFAQLMVAAGFARALSSDGPLALSEEFARNAKRGMWQETTPPATKACTAS